MDRIRELIEILNRASEAYYQEGREIMPNIEYDRLYDELVRLEKETGLILPDSPTQNVGSKVVSELPRERHASPMLSLDKTKSPDDLAAWLSDQEGVLSWKLDGLTIVLTYEDGKLSKAVTRGNGEIGEVVTGNALNFQNTPRTIPFTGRLVIRGEAVISYKDFETINAAISDADAKYKNPRNLCSGSVRQLDPKVTAKRHVRCVIFSLVSTEDEKGEIPAGTLDTFTGRFDWLIGQGFEVVEHEIVTAETVKRSVEDFKARIADNGIPSDGLVLAYNNIAYGESLGRTAKFPRNAIAFKWQDETAETILREVEWSPSRTGLINPVAIFDPVELEGTTVTRASVHNVSIVEDLGLGIGDRITVYKANMIIPQIAEDLTGSGTLPIPDRCPACGGKTEIRQDNDAKYLYCTDPACPAKKIKGFELMVSRDALNIEGLSEATLEKFIARGFIREYSDLFNLDNHRKEISEMEGFGDKSADNLIKAAEKASHTEMYRMIYGLGIPGTGLATARLICSHFDSDWTKIENASKEELMTIDMVGPVMAEAFTDYFRDFARRLEAERLYECLTIRKTEQKPEEEKIFTGMTFVITGDVHIFKNRKEVENLIESLGGHAAGSVSKNTNYLINNDIFSQSSKNKKAKELNIPIITEEMFIEISKGGHS